jgi:GNAT superfamily N-acetyltransferase
MLDNWLYDTTRIKQPYRIYVVVSQAGSPEILAYFTFAPDLQDVFSETSKFTAIMLNLLAVDSRWQRQGIGKWILLQIVAYIIQRAEIYEFDYLLVEPIDEEATSYYKHLNIGFVPLPSGRLALSIETMRQAVRSVKQEYPLWFENQKDL